MSLIDSNNIVDYEKETQILKNYLDEINPNLYKFLIFNKKNYFNQIITLTHEHHYLISYVKDYVSRNQLDPTTLLHLFNTQTKSFNYELAMFLVTQVSVFHKNSLGKNALMVYCENYSVPAPANIDKHFELLDLIFTQFESLSNIKFNLLHHDNKDNNIINQLCAKITINEHFSTSNATTFAYVLAKCNTILSKKNMTYLLTNKNCYGKTPYQTCLEYRNEKCLNILTKYQKILNLNLSHNVQGLIDNVTYMNLS